MEKAGIKRSVRALNKDGNNAWGVELRTAVKNGKKIIYLINVKKDNAEIVLKSGKKEIKRVKDLVDNKEIQMTYPYVVEPRKPVLLEILE